MRNTEAVTMNSIKTIFLEDLKDLVRTKKVIFVLAIMVFIIITVYVSGFLQVIYMIFFKPEKIIPFPISITYYLLFIIIPLFALLLGHDAVSSEVENSHIRGIISKISRNSFLFSKALSVFTIISLLNLVLLISSSIYTYNKVNQIDIVHPVIFFLYLTLYTASLTSVSIFFSSIFSKSTTSLFSIILLYLGLIYINIDKTAVISIFHYMNNIVLLENIGGAIIIFAAYAIVFLLSSLIIFNVKDL